MPSFSRLCAAVGAASVMLLGVIFAAPPARAEGPSFTARVPFTSTGSAPVTHTATRDASFSLVGATWEAGSTTTGAVVEVRIRTAQGWGAWEALEAVSDDPEAPGTEPAYAGSGVGVEARITGGAGLIAPALVLIDSDALAASPAPLGAPIAVTPGSDDGGLSPTGSTLPPAAWGATESTGYSIAVGPRIVTRAGWGANEDWVGTGLGGRSCLYDTDAIRGGVIHHTAGSNSYTAAEAPGIVRGIYYYHAVSLEWCDIGYNFLVDKYGTIYEGRTNSMYAAAVGAHSRGANTGSVGVSMLMNSDTAAPTSAGLTAMADVTAWRLNYYQVSPRGTTSFSGYTTPTLAGHRDIKTSATGCPGKNLYARMDDLRSMIEARQRRYTVAYDPPATREPLGLPSLTGTVTRTHADMSLAGRVEVDLRLPDGTYQVAAATATVSSAGNFSIPAMPLTDGIYKVRMRYLHSGFAQAITLWRSMTVSHALSIGTLSTPTVGQQLTVQGLAGQHAPGTTITIEYRDASQAWTTDSASATVATDGSFSIDSSWGIDDAFTSEVRAVADPYGPDREESAPLTMSRLHNPVYFYTSVATTDEPLRFSGRTSPNLVGTTVHVVSYPDYDRIGASAVVQPDGSFAGETDYRRGEALTMRVRAQLQESPISSAHSVFRTMQREGTGSVMPLVPMPTASPIDSETVVSPPHEPPPSTSPPPAADPEMMKAPPRELTPAASPAPTPSADGRRLAERAAREELMQARLNAPEAPPATPGPDHWSGDEPAPAEAQDPPNEKEIVPAPEPPAEPADEPVNGQNNSERDERSPAAQVTIDDSPEPALTAALPLAGAVVVAILLVWGGAWMVGRRP